MKIVSTEFEDGEQIPIKCSKKGNNTPPTLKFIDIPDNSKSLVLIMYDPGGPLIKFVHWILINIPPDITEISNSNFRQFSHGMNSLRRNSYLGPCPPYGTHRYFFILYALDTILDLDQKTTRKKTLRAMTGHIIDEAHLIGTFKK